MTESSDMPTHIVISVVGFMVWLRIYMVDCEDAAFIFLSMMDI